MKKWNKQGFVMLKVIIGMLIFHLSYWGILKLNYFLSQRYVQIQNFYESQIQLKMLHEEINQLKSKYYQDIEAEIKTKMRDTIHGLSDSIDYQTIQEEDQFGAYVIGIDRNQVILYIQRLYMPKVQIEKYSQFFDLEFNGIMLNNNLPQPYPTEDQENQQHFENLYNFFLDNNYQLRNRDYSGGLYYYYPKHSYTRTYLFNRGQAQFELTKDYWLLSQTLDDSFMRQEIFDLEQVIYTIETEILHLEKPQE